MKVLPQTKGIDGKRRLCWCAFCKSGESVTRHLADISPWRVLKSGHVTITKIDNLHISTRRKIHWFQKCYSFRSTTTNNEVIAEKPFQYSGVTRRLWTLGRLELTLFVNTSFWLLFLFLFSRHKKISRHCCRPYKLSSDLNSQPKRPGDLDLWPFDLESGVRVTCDVGYLCANFSLPRPLSSRLRPDVRDRQTSDVRHHTASSLIAPAY